VSSKAEYFVIVMVVVVMKVRVVVRVVTGLVVRVVVVRFVTEVPVHGVVIVGVTVIDKTILVIDIDELLLLFLLHGEAQFDPPFQLLRVFPLAAWAVVPHAVNAQRNLARLAQHQRRDTNAVTLQAIALPAEVTAVDLTAART